ncbi:hypothetical protein DERP_009974, partial [Dermatophagoides pteronyssinus]
FC